MAGRRQFGLKHLLVAVAVCAVVFALARWSLEAAVTIVAASLGYVGDRRSNGPGISGAMLYGAVALCFTITLIDVYNVSPVARQPAHYEAVRLLAGAPAGLFGGLLVFMVLAKVEPRIVAWFRGGQEGNEQADGN